MRGRKAMTNASAANSCGVASIACKYPKLTKAFVATCIVCSSPLTLPILIISSPALLFFLSLSLLISSSPSPSSSSSSSSFCHLNSTTPKLFLCWLYNHARKYLFLPHDNSYHHGHLKSMLSCPHPPNKLNTHTYDISTNYSSTSTTTSTTSSLETHHEDSLPCSFLYKVVEYHPYGGGGDEESVPDFMSQLDYVWRQVTKLRYSTFILPPHNDIHDYCQDHVGDGDGDGD